MPLTCIPDHVSDNAVREKIKVIQAANLTATTSLAAVKTSVDAFKVAAAGMTDPQVGTLQTAVNTAVTDLAAVVTAITASKL